MKTRTKGFILSFILVFAMLIGVFTIMPMTASAAGASEPATTSTGNPIFNEVDVAFSIGGEQISKFDSTDFKKYKGDGWELVVNRRENVTTFYYFDLYLDDYDGEGILFTIKNLNPTSTVSDVIFDLHISGECYVSGGININLWGEHLNEDYKTTGMPAGIISTGTVSIRFAPGSSLDVSSSLEIVNTAYLENIFNIVGSSDKEKPSSMSASCITHSRVNWNSNKTQTYINNGSIGIDGYHNLFLDGSVPTKVPPSSTLVGIMDYSAAKTVYSFAETTNLFFAGYSGSFADIKSMFVASSAGTKVVASAISLSHKTQIGNSKDGPFIALSDNGADLLKVGTSGSGINEGVEDAIRNILACPQVADGLKYFGTLEDPNGTFYVKTSYELTNADTGEKVASATINGSLFFGTNFLERQDGTLFEEGSDKYTFKLKNYVSSLECGSYTFTYTSTLYLNGEVFEQETKTFNTLVTNEDGSVDGLIIDAKVNNESCVNNGYVAVPMQSSSGVMTFSVTFKKPAALNSLPAPLIFKPTVSYDIDRTRWVEMDEKSYTLTDNGDGTYTITVSTNTGYVGMNMRVNVALDIVNSKASWDTQRLASYTIGAQVVQGQSWYYGTADVEIADKIDSSMTPSDVSGIVNDSQGLVSKGSEKWYEVNADGTRRPMADNEKFVGGKSYVYEIALHTQDTVHLGDTFTLTFNGVKGGKVGGSVYTWRTLYTAKTAFTAEAIEDKMTVAYNGDATFEVIATGERLLYSWKAVEDGAPQITSATNTDTLVVYGNRAGTWHYTCTVWEQNNGDVNYKTITVTLTVEEKVQTPADIFTPAHPKPVGTGLAGVDDINNLTVIKGESIVLKPTFTFGTDPNDLWHDGKTPVAGTLSYEWQLWVNDPVNGVIIKDLGTGDTLVIDKNLHETYNTGNICSFSIMVTITNTAMIGDESLKSSNWSGVTINVIEPDATGTVTGLIEEGEKEASPYALRRSSARSSTNFEGTIVYLVRENEIVYATEANAQGYYTFTNVLYGSYSVKIEKEGYEEYNRPIEVNAAEVNLDVTIIIHECFSEDNPMLWRADHRQQIKGGRSLRQFLAAMPQCPFAAPGAALRCPVCAATFSQQAPTFVRHFLHFVRSNRAALRLLAIPTCC